MNWYNKLKFAASSFMYHGTSINNLSSILSEGLNTSHNKVYDENFKNEKQERHLESYQGVYFTDALRTAVISGLTASGKNKVPSEKVVLVMS